MNRSDEAGFRCPGHTEYLGELAKNWAEAAFPVMMIWSEKLAVAPVTIPGIDSADAVRRNRPAEAETSSAETGFADTVFLGGPKWGYRSAEIIVFTML
jgi:hypothetical protein